MNLSYGQRVALLGLLTGCAVLLMLARLVLMQVLEYDEWAAKAEAQVAGWRPVHARRGRILDRAGSGLAVDEAGFDLSVRAAAWESLLHTCKACGFRRWQKEGDANTWCPRCRARDRLVPTDRRDLSRVARLLSISEYDLLARIEKRVFQAQRAIDRALGDLEGDRRRRRYRTLWADFGWRDWRIARDVPYEVAREVELHAELNPAFRIRTVHTRRTPGGRDFAHIVGRVREVSRSISPPDGDPRPLDVAQGATGLEAALEPELRGETGWLQLFQDPRRRERRVIDRHAPVNGLDVRLTIATEDQRRARLALHGVQGAFIVVHAETGAVLAMVSEPSYEPEEFGQVFERLRARKAETGKWPRYHALQEAACRDFFAPGSIMKPFTTVAALSLGVSEPQTRVRCEHYFTNRRGQRIEGALRCDSTHGELDLDEALVHSCNIYFQTLMRRLDDRELFPRYVELCRRFGFGRPTGIEIERRTTAGSLRFRERRWHDRILAAIGQGDISVSPAQVARAYAGLATGFLPRLHLVAEVGLRRTVPERERLAVPAAVLGPVRAALRAVPRRGTARGHRLQTWRIACKTGTAQRGGERYNAWMAGFAPAQAGRPPVAFAMVVLDTPLHGSEACGPRLEEFFDWFFGGAAE